MIPNGEIVKVQIKIRRGGFDDFDRGWTGGYAKLGKEGAVYLDCEFSVVEGPYKGKKFYSLIGLYSPRSEWWGNNGRSQIRDILNSTHNLSAKDYSLKAKKLRKLVNLGQLDNLIFELKVKIEALANGRQYNKFDRAMGCNENEEHTDRIDLSEHPETVESESATSPMWMI